MPSPQFTATTAASRPSFNQTRRWWRWAVTAIAFIGLCCLSARWYGLWLATDRLPWIGTADCIVTLSGYEQNKHASEWMLQGRVQEIWILRVKDSLFVEFGIHERGADTSVRELHKLGVSDSRIRVLQFESTETEVPRLLQEIGQATERFAANQVVIACATLEPRFLRQIADAALPSQQANRLRFVSLPHDEYTAPNWWIDRSGWKCVYQVSLEMLANCCFNPTSGFDPPHWNPDEWELQTFPQTSPARP